MTQFDFFVPLIALGVGVGIALYVRHAARRLDAAQKDRQPAE